MNFGGIMSIVMITKVLAWCLVINYSILLVWFLFFIIASHMMYKWHAKWFKISVERFHEIHYFGIAIYKLLILVFNLVPYLALRIMA